MAYEARTSPNTIQYTPQSGDALASIVAANPGYFATWQDLAEYNFGTSVAREVNRRLLESVGCSSVDAVNPELTVLEPHADAANPPLFIAKPFTATGLPPGRTHVAVVAPLRPPTALGIDALDQWFIPGLEACELLYSLEGLAACAERVELEVRGSNYSASGAWNNGLASFPASADLPNEILYEQEENANAPERGSRVAIAQWRGTVTTTQGALGTKTPLAAGGQEDRVINVAFSPYTVLLRYFKDPGDANARLSLGAFWPQFDAANAPVQSSLTIRWNVHDTARFGGGNGNGQILVVDQSGNVVFRKPLSQAELGTAGGAFHEFVWNGRFSQGATNSAGGDIVIPADMPYRVRVEMHTGVNQAQGLALAAMQTEVRLYVDSATHRTDLNPYVAATDATSILLGCSEELLTTTTAPLTRADGTAWCKLQLARAGFHAGPVNGNAAAPAYQNALREFKRSVPRRKANPGDTFQRLPQDLSEGADVLDALEDLTASATWQRPWFADNARADLNITSPAFLGVLQNPASDLIVWADDRHFYTDPDWAYGARGPRTRTRVTSSVTAMGNYMGGFAQGDSVVNRKRDVVLRPWIPLSADFILLSRTIRTPSPPRPSPSQAELAAMRKAIGPLRVDWTFDEIDVDPPAEDTANPANYGRPVTRTHAHLSSVRAAAKATHNRVDVHKSSVYANCPQNRGGIRPSGVAQYYRAPFGRGNDALEPWSPLTSNSRQSIVTVIHDNLGQAAADLVYGRIGQAGVAFQPSTIGGDGYQVRAQLWLESEGGYRLPNLPVLKERYPLLPQAQSARMRVWRKASIRSYVSWSNQNHWGAVSAAMRQRYEPAYLHLVDECGDANVNRNSTDFLANDANFQDAVRVVLDPAAAANSPDQQRSQGANIQLAQNSFWPWTGTQSHGVFESSLPNATRDAATTRFFSTNIEPIYDHLTLSLGEALVRAIEEQTGKFRGHTVVELRCVEQFLVGRYGCPTCNRTYFYVERTRAGGDRLGQRCPAPGCAGALAYGAPLFIGHYTCPNGHQWQRDEPGLGAGVWTGQACFNPTCQQPLAADQVNREQYTCNVCGWSDWLPESGAGGDHSGTPCMQAGCAGVLQHAGGWEEDYECNQCHLHQTTPEVAAAGGSQVGVVHAGCAHAPPGTLQHTAPPVIRAIHNLVPGDKIEMSRTGVSDWATKDFPVASLGDSTGVAYNTEGDAELWAHELGHTRFMEHAGGAPGAANNQHDHRANNTFNWAAIGETAAHSQGWDRACMMTYINQQPSYSAARDVAYFCGKCALKLRGWRVQNVSNPAANVHD